MKNKKTNLIIFSILFIIMSTSIVFADTINYGNLCSDYNEGIGSAVRILGYAVLAAKWIVPLIIIVLGMVDFGQAVISDDEKAISKAAYSLLRRFIAGIAVFFVPTIILAFLNLIQVTGSIEETTRFNACTKCILNASKYCPLD